MAEFSFDIGNFEYFLMVLARIASFVFVAPFFSLSGVPRRTKVGFSCVVAIMMYFLLPVRHLEYDTVIEFAAIVIKETVTGLMIGMAANICTTIIAFAGTIIDMEIGLSMATLFDPVTKQNTSITGALYNYFVLIILIVSDMHHFIFRALIDSYTLVPIDGAMFDTEHLLESMLKFLVDYVVIGFRIALPYFATMLITNVVLGILAKVAPQMNMFAVGMQIKLLIGMGVMFLTIGLLPSISQFIFGEMKTMIVRIIEGFY